MLHSRILRSLPLKLEETRNKLTNQPRLGRPLCTGDRLLSRNKSKISSWKHLPLGNFALCCSCRKKTKQKTRCSPFNFVFHFFPSAASVFSLLPPLTACSCPSSSPRSFALCSLSLEAEQACLCVCMCGFRARGQGEASSAKCNAFCHPDKDKLILFLTKHWRSPFGASAVGVICRPVSLCEGETVHILGV